MDTSNEMNDRQSLILWNEEIKREYSLVDIGGSNGCYQHINIILLSDKEKKKTRAQPTAPVSLI